MNESSTKNTVVFIQEYVSKPNSPESILGMFDAVFGMTVTKPHIFLLDEKKKKRVFWVGKRTIGFSLHWYGVGIGTELWNEFSISKRVPKVSKLCVF